MLISFCSEFLYSSVASSALLRVRGFVWETLYRRKLIKDRRAIRRVPNETPIPIPTCKDLLRIAVDDGTDVEIGVEADVKADVEVNIEVELEVDVEVVI